MPPKIDWSLSNAKLAKLLGKSASWVRRERLKRGMPSASKAGRPRLADDPCVSSSINMPKSAWDSLDRQRGKQGRSAWVREKVREGEKK